MTNGISYSTAYIILPISPRAIFIAANTYLQLNHLKAALADGSLIDHVNHTVAAQAKKFVYFVDDSQLDFVKEQLGTSSLQCIGDRQNVQSA